MKILFVITLLLITSDVLGIISKKKMKKLHEIDLLKSARLKKKIKVTTDDEISKRFLVNEEMYLAYEEDSDYFTVALGLGSPAQYFAVQVDTTTSVSWVPSTHCTNCNSTTKYSLLASDTAKTENKTRTIYDEDGDIKGVETFDWVQIKDLAAPGYGFVAATSLEEGFGDHEDGKLGLGYRKSDGGDQFSFLDILKNKGLISDRIFSIKEVNETHGRLTLGDYPKEFDRNDSAYNFCNVTSTEKLAADYQDAWACDLTQFSFGKSRNFSEAYQVNGKAIFDSGYSYISVPYTYLGYFLPYVFNQSLMECKEILRNDESTFICSLEDGVSIAQIPEVNFILNGGYGKSIKAEDLFEQTDVNKYEFLIKFSRSDDYVWALGHPFLSQYTVVFNGEENHVGFYGGNSIDFTKEWTAWSQSQAEKDQQKMYLIIGAGALGSLLFLSILFIIYHSFKRRSLEEHGPLINEGNDRH